MPAFKYSARDASGKKIDGTLDSKSQDDAVAEIKKKGLTVMTIEAQAAAGAGLFAGMGKVSAKSARVSLNDILLFTRQLATMISAGIPLLECLEILSEQTDNQGFRACLNEVVGDVRGGTDLSTALAKHPRVFEDIYVNMIRAGEVSGQIDEILVRLAEYQEATAALRAKIKAAMTYPVISICMIMGITAFLLIFIIPKFKEIFDNMNVELPWITSFLLAVADFASNQWYVVLGGTVAFGFLVYSYAKTPFGRRHVDYLKLQMPIFGPLFKKVSISRFARTFGTLIESGVPILGALEIVASTAGNKIIEDLVMDASESVRQGETLATPLATKPNIFPPMVTRMIAIGEKSGALEQLLNKISEFYDQQVEVAVEQLTSLIEPLMIGIMGFMVGGMVLAIFLPIFKLQQTLMQ
ncbi:MAG: type II secretion system F family protein [Planctomycetota bacterium]